MLEAGKPPRGLKIVRHDLGIQGSELAGRDLPISAGSYPNGRMIHIYTYASRGWCNRLYRNRIGVGRFQNKALVVRDGNGLPAKLSSRDILQGYERLDGHVRRHPIIDISAQSLRPERWSVTMISLSGGICAGIPPVTVTAVKFWEAASIIIDSTSSPTLSSCGLLQPSMYCILRLVKEGSKVSLTELARRGPMSGKGVR